MTIAPSIELLTVKQLVILDLAAQQKNPSEIGRELGMERRHVIGQLTAIQNVIGVCKLHEAIAEYRSYRNVEA